MSIPSSEQISTICLTYLLSDSFDCSSAWVVSTGASQKRCPWQGSYGSYAQQRGAQQAAGWSHRHSGWSVAQQTDSAAAQEDQKVCEDPVSTAATEVQLQTNTKTLLRTAHCSVSANIVTSLNLFIIPFCFFILYCFPNNPK